MKLSKMTSLDLSRIGYDSIQLFKNGHAYMYDTDDFTVIVDALGVSVIVADNCDEVHYPIRDKKLAKKFGELLAERLEGLSTDEIMAIIGVQRIQFPGYLPSVSQEVNL